MLTPHFRLMSRVATATSVLALTVTLLVVTTGCVEIALLLQDALPSTDHQNGGTNTPTPEDGDNNNTDPAILPSVVLRASNTNPNIGEQLILTCDLQGQAPIDTRYTFSDSSNRLIQTPSSNTASMTISESDVGIQFQFRCSASFPDGMSSNSSTISVIPVG